MNSESAKHESPCNLARFEERVYNIENAERGLCRCCGRYIRYELGDDGTPDWYCRRCLGELVSAAGEQLRLVTDGTQSS